ncbi:MULTISPECIES: hypothetical protein [Paenibacillus]|uniref:hypothetical protein n=1 Tax=Paenibacillus TaxID=44249 RepID=UPI0010598592|nr:hypothetical protein [Paenibacillus amylolyticus]TDL69868.1 hypothetical protein E2R58_12125 [Paenibacillus amylolyticus]
MSENILLGPLRRYEFYSYCSNFISELYKTVTQELYGDIHWEWSYYNNNDFAIPRSWNSTGRTAANQGTITAKNVKDPSMFFTISMNFSRFYTTYDYVDYTRSYVWRVGLRNNGADVKPDLYTNVGHMTEIPLNTCIQDGGTRTHNAVNTFYKWNLFITDTYIFFYGEPQGGNQAYPVRLYMGRLRALEQEDPLIANDFVGIFGHYPSGLNNDEDELMYRAGRGYVRSSRNGQPNAQYHFATSSQVPSPGVGGRFFISPFYVWHENEGIRGEFYGVKTAVLRDSSMYPDGSILDLGDERYYVFHALSQQNPSTYQGWVSTAGGVFSGQPYFFDSPLLLGGGQRVLLFEIEKEV